MKLETNTPSQMQPALAPAPDAQTYGMPSQGISPRRYGCFPGYQRPERCNPRPPSSDYRALFNQLRDMIEMLSKLLRKLSKPTGPGCRPGYTPPPSPPVKRIEVKPTPPELQRFVGLPLAQAQALARQEGITDIRVIGPDPRTPITEDHRPKRLNLHVSDSGIVTRADKY
jgi:hypothetical protein